VERDISGARIVIFKAAVKLALFVVSNPCGRGGGVLVSAL
jgi:hypothetical protein